MPHGISNSNYLVSTNQLADVLLKVSNDKNEKELNEEMEILLYLNQCSFPLSLCPFIQKSPHSGPVYSYKNLNGVLFPKAKGTQAQVNSSSCFEMGKALSMLHRIPLPASSNKKSLRPYAKIGHDLSDILAYSIEKKCPPDFHYCFESLTKQANWNDFKKFYQQIPSTIIHGDLYYDNVFFDQGKPSAFLDFEQAGIGNPLLDLGIAISGTCLKNGELDHEYIQSYFSGYKSTQILDPKCDEFLFTAIQLGLLSISLWRIERFLEGSLSLDRKFSYQELLKLKIPTKVI